MTKVVETATMVLGGLSIFAVCFLGFSITAGVPLNRVAVVGRFFDSPEEGTEIASRPTAESPPRARTDSEVIRSNVDVLGLFSLPSPYTQEELRSLTDELKTRLQMLEDRSGALDEREREASAREDRLDERFEGLRALQQQLEEYEARLTLREQEVQREEVANQARQDEKWAQIAKLFDNLEGEAAASFLAEYPPDEAAGILSHVDSDKAADILSTLRGQRGVLDWKAYVDAYSEAASRSE